MNDRPVRHRRSPLGPLKTSDPLLDDQAGAVQLSRRALLGRVVLAAGTLGASGLLASCSASSGGQGQQPAAGSLRALVGNVQQLTLLNAQSELPAGRGRFAFGLSAEDNRLVEGVAPQVWFAKDQASKALGPFSGRWLEMTGYDETSDRSPRSELAGFYVAAVNLSDPGNWLAVALVEVASQRAAAQGAIPVRQQVVAQVGTKALSGPTPVATSASARRKICTREPPCPLHYISFDQALESGRPTVLSFATPLLCPSRMCGPVIDEQMVVFEKLESKANFIHVELFPQRDTNKPAPLFTTWGFESEPWMMVIDSAGIIRARFGDGPVVGSEIEAALQPLLS